MKKFLFLLVLVAFGFMTACSGQKPYHKAPMPDPKSFNGHFGDMDSSGDDLLDWDEFKSHFAHAVPKVFKAIDLNKDNMLDHDEWHQFKSAHGMKHHD